MNKITIEVTEDEQKIILQARRNKIEKEKARKATLLHLKAAYEFETWLQETGSGRTWSTFCNDFPGGENYIKDVRWQVIENILNSAEIRTWDYTV